MVNTNKYFKKLALSLTALAVIGISGLSSYQTAEAAKIEPTSPTTYNFWYGQVLVQEKYDRNGHVFDRTYREIRLHNNDGFVQHSAGDRWHRELGYGITNYYYTNARTGAMISV